MALEDYSALIQSGQNLVPDVNRQLALQAQAQNWQAEAAANQAKVATAEQFQHDIHSFDGSAAATSHLILKYPEYAEHLKQAYSVQDGAKKQADLLTMGEIYSAASGGNWKLAKELAHKRADAERAAGHSDPAYDASLAALDAAADGDPTQQKLVKNMLGMSIAAITGPDKFTETYGALTRDKSYTLAPGDTRFSEDNTPVASVAAKPDFLVVPEGGKAIPLNPAAIAAGSGQTGGGDPASGAAGVPTGVSPAAASVASTLTAAGLPAPVVAGFMGNFHAEGGYDGAQGDGGSASGIGQWRGPRAASFERVIGKPATEATPAEQAQFVAWEMKNPQAAGMTVAQRDAILSAKTPAQAAALIDQHYERSSGRDRQVRMAAANAFAGTSGGASSVETPTAGGAPSGARTGDAPGTVYGNPKPQARTLTQSEATARGLSPAKVYEQRPDGTVSAIGDSAPATAPGNPELTGPEYLADLHKNNASLAAQVQGVLDTRLAYPPATARSPQAQQLRAAVLQADPNYDEQAYARRKTTIQQYTPGHAGPGASMLSAATLINHMYDLAQAAHNLPDHSTAAQNAVSAWWGSQTNAPWLIKYNEGRKFVASELPKFLEGKAPTEGQVHEHMDSYSPSKGKSGIQTAIATDVDYLYGRYQPLLQAYKDNTGKDLNIDTYAPGQATRAKAAALEYYRTNGALPTIVTNPSQAAKLPHGSVFATPDGRILRRH